MKRVLVADDEKDCCDFFKDYLARRGCAVDIAYDGANAKDLISAREYDYIFFDCNMPGLSGVELIEVIKSRNPGARKIMISGYDLIDEGLARDFDVDVFLRKPVSLEDIRKIIA